MRKILAIFGTRPEAIKMAPLVKELNKRADMDCIVCITGQHRQMLDQILKAFHIKADFDLNIMKPNQTLTNITVDVLSGIEAVIKEIKPDMVLVHGDTTTAFASALAAYYQRIPIGHVEAGLRTWNKYSPFPEELNRQMIDCMANLYFAPTMQSKRNLIAEGKSESAIIVTGNTAIDALKTTVRNDYEIPALDWIGNSRLLLLTAHRRENHGEPLYHLFRAIKQIVNEFADVKVIYPVHMNPQVRSIAEDVLAGNERIQLIEPMEVIDFHNLMNKSYLILTDSGGIQEEAPSLGKPVLVLRDTTERPEGIAAGTLKLVGTNEAEVYRCIKELLCDEKLYKAMSNASNPYGNGTACQQIADAITKSFLV